MTYTAPLADMRFVLREVAGLGTGRRPAGLRARDRRHASMRCSRRRPASPATVLAPLNRERRQGGRQAGERRGAHRAGLHRRLQAVRRGRLERRCRSIRSSAARACRGCWRAPCRRCGRRPTWASAVPAADPGRDRRARPSRLGRAEGRPTCRRWSRGEWTGTMNLTEPQAGSDLGALQARRAVHERRPLPHHRPEDLHHLRRARPHRQHRPPGAGAHARRAAPACKGISLFIVPKFLVERRRLARRAQRRALRVARAQARHPRQPDLRAWRSATTAAPSATSSARKNRGLEYMFIMMNSARAVGRHPGRWRSPSAPTSRRSPCARSACRARPTAAAAGSRCRSSTIPTCAACC